MNARAMLGAVIGILLLGVVAPASADTDAGLELTKLDNCLVNPENRDADSDELSFAFDLSAALPGGEATAHFGYVALTLEYPESIQNLPDPRSMTFRMNGTTGQVDEVVGDIKDNQATVRGSLPAATSLTSSTILSVAGIAHVPGSPRIIQVCLGLYTDVGPVRAIEGLETQLASTASEGGGGCEASGAATGSSALLGLVALILGRCVTRRRRS